MCLMYKGTIALAPILSAYRTSGCSTSAVVILFPSAVVLETHECSFYAVSLSCILKAIA
jgi:hypothetical protein